MAIKCSASNCPSTDKSGKIFYQCGKCGRWWCSEHGYNGKECPACHKGYLKQP